MPDTNETQPVDPQEDTETLREHLDRRLEWARKNVLALCEAKAKAEFLGLLDAPRRDLEKMLYS